MDPKKNNESEAKTNLLEGGAIISIIVGVLILIFYIIRYKGFCATFSGEFDIESSAKVGDFIGGVVGAFWTLASTLFFYNTLQLQRAQLEDNKIQLTMQDNEIKNQVSKFEFEKIKDTIFQRVDLFRQKQSKVEFEELVILHGVPKSIKYYGVSALERCRINCSILIDSKVRNNFHTEMDDDTIMNVVDDFLNNVSNIEFLDYLDNSLDMSSKLIDSRSDKYLSKKDINFLYLLLNNSFELDKVDSFNQVIIQYYELLLKIYGEVENNDLLGIEYIKWNKQKLEKVSIIVKRIILDSNEME